MFFTLSEIFLLTFKDILLTFFIIVIVSVVFIRDYCILVSTLLFYRIMMYDFISYATLYNI